MFKTNKDKVKSRDSGGERNTVRVRHTAFSTAPDSAKNLNGDLLGANNRAASRNQRSPAKSPPECFLCAEKHYLADCAKFNALSNHLKRQTVIDSCRCLNCLSLGHPVRNCAHQSKCRKCRPDSKTKHAPAFIGVARIFDWGGPKPSKIRLSSPKLRVNFGPKSEIRTIFPPKIR